MLEPHKTGLLVIRVSIWICFLALSIQLAETAIQAKNRTSELLSGTPPEFGMVLIPAGEFLMGSDEGRSDEAPAHPVYLDGFWLDQYEVNNQDYAAFLKATNRNPPRYWQSGSHPSGQANYPVVGVRWKDAQAYCVWAGKRLPSEAEWEKACRGPEGQIYPWGDNPDPNRANVGSLAEGPYPEMWEEAWALARSPASGTVPALAPVGSYPAGASPYGIYDLVGNASEWVADYYNWDGYWEIDSHNPLILEPTWNHVLRGSAWFMPYGEHLGEIDSSRCSSRSSSHGDTHDPRTGFRCALSAVE